jgi:hypothetical protein
MTTSRTKPFAITFSARYVDSRGEYLMLVTSQLGPCGRCGDETCCFITRDGVTACALCDARGDMACSGQQRHSN